MIQKGIITGEKDKALNNQQNLVNRLEKSGAKTKITIIEGIGHQFAKDFPTILDQYLNWINE